MPAAILINSDGIINSIEMSRKSHNHRTQPTNDTKRKSKQTMTDSTQATDQKEKQSNQLPLHQQDDHSARQHHENMPI